LKYLSKHVDLDDPEQVKSYIADKKCSNSFKNGLVKSYNHYVQNSGLTWKNPTTNMKERYLTFRQQNK
jgi:hypothetical protein